jgi:hypothetical protein
MSVPFREFDVLVNDPWPWFQAPTGKAGESWGIYLRCPACGAVVDWRDQALHARFHGVNNQASLDEITERQEEEWGQAPTRDARIGTVQTD